MQNQDMNQSTGQAEEMEPALQEALAVYFEQGSDWTPAQISNLSAAQQTEWQQMQALLKLPQAALEVRPSVASAWQSFRSSHFEMATATETASLGNYVAQALDQQEQTTLKESGLSKATLEALKADNTPLESLKDYELNDYARLARRYEVKDNAFPRMLKWLKGLSKSLTFSSGNFSRGAVFARDEETRPQKLNETDLAQELTQEPAQEPAQGLDEQNPEEA